MKKELLTYKDPKSPVSEVFRTLRTNIQFMNTNRKLKTLLVTSTFPEEGKSWVTANLAVTFAQAGKKVILVDADMRKGRQYKIFDVLPKPGLSNYLSNMDAEDMEVSNINIVNYIQATGVDNLHVLVAGNVPPNPSELLVSTRMRQLLKELKEMCDLIIIDGTPCDLVTDSIILSRFVDSTIIVTAQKETKKEALQRITKNIQNVGGRIAGVIVNKVDMSSKKYKQTYYYGSISGASLNNSEKSEKKSNKSKSDYFMSNLLKNINNKDDEQIPEEENERPTEDYDINYENDIKDIINKNLENEINNEANNIVDNLVKQMDNAEEIQENYEEPKEELENPQEETPIIEEPKVEDFHEETPIIEEPQKTPEELQKEKEQEIMNIVNNYVQDELNKHNNEGMY